jgi:hypothetical protein
MAEKDKILAEKVKHSGIFSFSELYEYLYDWFSDESYKVREKKYTEKILGDSKTIEIEWENERKISDYFKFQIKLTWLITGLKKVEVKKEDQKVTMNSGTVEIKFSAMLIKDYESRWENQPFWKFLRGVYDRYIIRTRIDYYEDRVEDDLREIVAQTKAFLALESRKG